MKNECYIVRDLLPSYIDDLCSGESSRFVEQHITICPQCTEFLKQMRVEFDVQDQSIMIEHIEQKKPFQKIAYFFNAQKGYTTLLSRSLWIFIIVTIGFLIHSLTMLTDLNDEREAAQAIEKQKQDIMEETFAVLSRQNDVDETALQAVFKKHKEQLQYLAVFSTENIADFTRLQEGPTNTFPINYRQAMLVVGEDGEITESIIPNDYDIGTVAMANDQWIVQFEYQEAYLETIENAFQIKHYSPSNWTVFQLPIVFSIITVFIFGNWLFQKRIIKPVKNILD